MKLPDGLGTVSFDGVERWNKIQISRTPGKFVALAGVVLALIGLLGSLFIRSRRIWVRARREGDGTLVEVAALERSGGGDVSVALAEHRGGAPGSLAATGTEGEVVTDAAWETLSNQAVAACGVVYFLALLAYLVEWSALRKVPVAAEAAVVAEGSDGGVALATGGEADEDAARRTAMFGRLGLLLTVLAVAIQFVALVSRGMAADPNRVPWGNMYEFTLAGTFVVAALYLALYRKFSLAWMAPIVVGFVLILLMVAVIWLYDPVAPLTEALYSPWLVIHVVSAIIATGAFTLGGICSALYLIKERAQRKPTGYLARVPEPAVLDRVSYRLHAFGFPVWTFAVLITGPIWAHQAWSTYWNWDPKEVWAFITWVVYAAYLHARSTAGWKGRNAALLALLGLATLWFNFIGINFFSSDLAALLRRSGHPRRVGVGHPLNLPGGLGHGSQAVELLAVGDQSATRLWTTLRFVTNQWCRGRQRALDPIEWSKTATFLWSHLRLGTKPHPNASTPRSMPGIRVLGMFLLLVQVAQEVRIVVGAGGAGRRGLRRRQHTAALDHSHYQIDGDPDQDDHEKELQHPSRVGPDWSSPTLEG